MKYIVVIKGQGSHTIGFIGPFTDREIAEEALAYVAGTIGEKAGNFNVSGAVLEEIDDEQ